MSPRKLHRSRRTRRFQASVARVSLQVNEIVTLNLALEVSAPRCGRERYRLHRSRQPVQRQDRHCLRSKKIIDLPLNARNIVGLLSLHPGVTLSDKTGEFDRDEGGQVNGARTEHCAGRHQHQSAGAWRRSETSAARWILCRNLLSKPALAKAAGRGIGAQVQLVTRSGATVPRTGHSPTEPTAPTDVLLY